MLAMHMANELLTPAVAGLFLSIAAVFLFAASWRVRTGLPNDRVVLMGVMGAFVFAAQMINFPVLPGTSGHLGGGVLLAILLGPHAGTLVIAAILIVQCLIFQDGGLLALGTNIFNLGIIPCYLGGGLFAVLAGKSPSSRRLYVAVFAATLVGMVAGAAMVPLEVWMSGRLTVPLADFAAVMVGLHVLVGLGEAIITFLVIGYVVRVRPQLLGEVSARLSAARAGMSRTGVAVSLSVVALLLACVVSLWASSSPDALESIASEESAVARVEPAGEPAVQQTTQWQERTAPLPDYQVPGLSESLGTSVSGLIGTVVTLLVVWGAARWLRRSGREHALPPTG